MITLQSFLADGDAVPWPMYLGLLAAACFLLYILIVWVIGVRYIPNNKVGIVEKLWSHKGSLGQGRLVATNGEAGYQTEMLRGGLRFF